jgi:flavin-binding protein dodecin
MARLLLSLKALLLAAGIFALVVSGLAVMRVSRETGLLVADARASLALMSDYAREQIVRLRDPKQQKSIDAAIQAAAVLNATARLVNRELVPRAMKTLDSVKAAVESVTRVAGSLDELVTATDNQINGHILPGASAAIAETAVALSQMRDSLKTAQDGSKTILDDIHRIAADPGILQAITAISRASDGLATMSEQGAEASRKVPAIAASLEKIAATSSKWQKALFVASIFGVLARAFW